MSARRKPYPFDRFEPKWQRFWDERRTFHTPNLGEKNFDGSKPKFYVLDMFPYPSGAGIPKGTPRLTLWRATNACAATTSFIRWAGTHSACRRNNTPSSRVNIPP